MHFTSQTVWLHASNQRNSERRHPRSDFRGKQNNNIIIKLTLSPQDYGDKYNQKRKPNLNNGKHNKCVFTIHSTGKWIFNLPIERRGRERISTNNNRKWELHLHDKQRMGDRHKHPNEERHNGIRRKQQQRDIASL